MLADAIGVPFLRDEEGAIRVEFATRVTQAIEAGRVDELPPRTAAEGVRGLDSRCRRRPPGWVAYPSFTLFPDRPLRLTNYP